MDFTLNFKLFKIGWPYNPISCFLSHVFGRRGYIWPRRIEFDSSFIKESGWSRKDPHSWWLIKHEFGRMLRKFKTQRYRTYDDFKKDPHKVCPECGSDDLDID